MCCFLNISNLINITCWWPTWDSLRYCSPYIFLPWLCTAIKHHLHSTTIQANKYAITHCTIVRNHAWKVFLIASITFPKIGMLHIDHVLSFSPMAKDVAPTFSRVKEEMGINESCGNLHTHILIFTFNYLDYAKIMPRDQPYVK